MGNNNFLIVTIMLVFILIGWVMPYLNTEFGHDSPTRNGTGLYNDVGSVEIGDDVSASDISIFEVIGSILSMFFWTFGSLHPIIDLIFIPFRVILVVIAYDKIRGI